jgi:hypothetical protein
MPRKRSAASPAGENLSPDVKDIAERALAGG